MLNSNEQSQILLHYKY